MAFGNPQHRKAERYLERGENAAHWVGLEGFLEKGRFGAATPKDGGVSWKEVRDSSLKAT